MSGLLSFIYSAVAGFNIISVILRLILSVIIGGIIGNERGKHGSHAGLRTHILVCLGSTITALTGLFVNEALGMQGDVLRLAAQVISGIGFLGAGMIIIKGSNIITGLTTAAGMWTTAAIGIALGYGFYSASVIGMLACLFTAHFLTKLERKRKMSHPIYIEVDDPKKSGDICSQIRVLVDNDMALEIAPAKSGIAGHLALYVTLSNTKKFPEIIETIKELDGVSFVIVE